MDHDLVVDHTRHMGIFIVPSALSVTLIGAGGIGAVTALTLAKMGVRLLSIIDFDTVEPENLSTQFFRLSDVGKPKVEAVADMIREFSDETFVDGLQQRVGPNDNIFGSIIISAVDSITARQDIWRALQTYPHWDYYLEARMGAEEFQLHTIVYDDTHWYSDYILSQNEDDVPELPCTSKATIFTGTLAASYIGNAVRKIVTGEKLPRKIAVSMPGNTLLAIP